MCEGRSGDTESEGCGARLDEVSAGRLGSPDAAGTLESDAEGYGEGRMEGSSGGVCNEREENRQQFLLGSNYKA